VGALLLQILAGVLRQIAISLGITALLTTLQNVLTSPNPAPSLPWWQADVKQLDDLLAYPGANFKPSSASVAVILDAVFEMALDYQQRGHDVTLPTTPPSGYGGASVDDVWHAGPFNPSDVDTGSTIGQTLIALRNITGNGGMVRMAGSRHTYINDALFSGVDEFGFSQVVHDDLSAALSGDTPLSFLLRENPTQDWTTNPHGWSELNPFASGNIVNLYLINDITQADIDAALLALAGGGAALVPPVWPGLAKVTLGTSVALVDGLVITTPMDGVIVELTAAPSGKVVHLLGGLPAYRWIGSLSFENDNGDQEASQQLSFANQVYTPRTLQAAAGVRFYVLGGVTGTVVPWVIT